MPFVELPNDTGTHGGNPYAYYAGDKEPALLSKTIGSHFADIVRQHPNRLAVKSNERRLTYKQLDEESDAVALALVQLGVKKGDRVATTLGINITHLVIIYACFKTGAILAPLNPSYSPQQAVSAIRHVGARCFFLSSHISLPYKQPRSTEPLLDAIAAARSDTKQTPLELESVVLVNNGVSGKEVQSLPAGLLWTFEDLFNTHQGQAYIPEALDPHDTINLQFTSGTTSLPKAVSLSHWLILNNARIAAHIWGTTNEDMYIGTMPLYHCGGLIAVVLAAMSHGAAISLPCESFNALQTLRAIKEDRCTVLHGVPTMFHAWIDLISLPEFANHDFSHIRSGLIGAAPILPSLRNTLNQRLHLQDVGNTWGMTETSAMATTLWPLDPLEKKYSTVGRPIPHQCVRVGSRDDPSRTLRVGEKGELLVSGLVMKEYWNDPKRTAAAIYTEALEDGTEVRWMRTGDEGMMDSEGFVTVTGRIKDIIIRGGENIYPPEIEDVIIQYPGVQSVSVVGLPDEIYGEVVAAFVVVDDTKASLCYRTSDDGTTNCLDLRRQVAKNQRSTAVISTDLPALSADSVRTWVFARLSKHLVPKYVVWMDELPLTPTGKVEKYKLREQGSAALIDVEAEKQKQKDSEPEVSAARTCPPEPKAVLRKRSFPDSSDDVVDRSKLRKTMVVAPA